MLAEGSGPLVGAAAAALVPLTSKSDLRNWIRRMCHGEITFNDANYLGVSLATSVNEESVAYFLEQFEAGMHSANNDTINKREAKHHGLETIIKNMNEHNKRIVREWSKSQGEEVRAVVARGVRNDETDESLEFLIEQWMLGTRGVAYPMYSALRWHHQQRREKLFYCSDDRIQQLMRWLSRSDEDDKRWSLELLEVVAREFPAWQEAVATTGGCEDGSLLQWAFRIASAKSHRAAATELLERAKAQGLSSDELLLLRMFDERDWQDNATSVIHLLGTDNVQLIIGIGDQLISTPMPRSLRMAEIDRLVERVSFWIRAERNRSSWIARARVIDILTSWIGLEGALHLVNRGNDDTDTHRKTILGWVLPSVSNTLVSTKDLNDESAQIMLHEYISNPHIDVIMRSPGAIATEPYIERFVLPEARHAKPGSRRMLRLQKILLQAGNRHGRRYQVGG